MAEWSNAAVLKTVVLRGTGGSNPSLSALKPDYQAIAETTPNFTPKNVKLGVFFLFGLIFALSVFHSGYMTAKRRKFENFTPSSTFNSTHNG